MMNEPYVRRRLAFANSAEAILQNMALERTSWWRRLLFGRWHIPDEPLRNDAARLLREHGVERMRPTETCLVGDSDES